MEQRQIKFRAKESITVAGKGTQGDWVYGFYHETHDTPERTESWITDKGGQHLVYPATRGEWIGLLDKNGREIYEGDILSNEYNVKFPVRWDDDEARFTNVANYAKHRIVIGNTWENPDLLV